MEGTCEDVKKGSFFSPLVFRSRKERERERERALGEMGLIINEDWHEDHDDSFFKLVFDKNKKELKSGQLGTNEEIKKQRETQVKE